MKLTHLLRLPLILAALSASALADYSWNFGQASGSAGAVDAPDASGSATLVFASGTGVVADASAPGGSALVFDGTQKDPGQTARALESFPAIEISLKFKPGATGPDAQTLVSVSASYEIRYNRKRGHLEFIVFHPEKKFVIVQNKIAPGAWNDVKAVFRDGKLALTVGTVTKEAALPAGVAIDPKGTRLRIGRQGDRIFVGALADLSIKAP